MTLLDKPALEPHTRPQQSRLPVALMYAAMTGLLAVLVASLLVIGVIGLLDDDAASPPAAGVNTAIDVALSEFAIDGDLTAPAGIVSVSVTNAGTQQHDLVVEELDASSPVLDVGDSSELALGQLEAGTYTLFCSVPGHRASGMETTLTVGAAATDGASGESSAAGDHGGHGDDFSDPDAIDAAMVESMLKFPAETEGVGNQILEPEILADGTKKFVLEASVIQWEVSPGEFVDAWAYNGQVPGPQIVVDVGDKVEVELTNNTPLGTDIHWHGIHTPNDQDGVAPFTQDPVRVGETYTYAFVAEDPAIGMYHAHLHSQISVLNGMFAPIRIGERPYPRGKTITGVTIPEDFEPDIELPMVLNDAGTIGLTLNGKSFPATAPVAATTGDWVAVDYYNEGLTPHPMHLHQFPQLIYAKDGFALDQPYWADTINVAPGERYSVIFQTSDPGVWAWHCHILTHVESDAGMFGMVTALVVTDETPT